MYKANEVATKLLQAEESVFAEVERLEQNTAEAMKHVEETFVNLETCLQKAKEGTLKSVAQLASRKRQLLGEQLDLIKKERTLVEKDVTGLQYQVEVRSLSDRIADFQKKLEVVSALAEPRENCYLIYEIAVKRAELEEQLDVLVCALGRPRSSTALPSLCHLRLSRAHGRSAHSAQRSGTHHGICGVVDTVDYHGSPKKEGGDPVQVTVVDSERQLPVACSILDVGNGSYRFWFRPARQSSYVIEATIFGRPVKNSPLSVQVIDQQKPHNVTGSKGSSDEQLFQPSGIAVACSGCRESDDCTVYVLDAGNERIAKYSRHLQLLGYLRSSAVAGHSATGMCATQCGTRLWIANWKLRSVMEVASDSGAVLRTVSLAFMKEPVDVALNSCGHLLIADAERATVYVVELLSSSNECRLLYECGSRGGGPGQFQQNTLRTVTSGANDDVVAADATRIQIFSRQGKFIRSLSTTIVKGLLGGLSYDGRSRLLATYNEAAKKKTASTAATASRCGVWVIHYTTGQVLFNFDSAAADLRRPGRICCTTVNQEEFKSSNTKENGEEEAEAEAEAEAEEEEQPYQAGYIYVTDVGDDSVKQFRYL